MFYQINKNSGLFQTHVFVTHVFVTLSQNAVSNQLKCLVLSTKCVFPMLSPSAASFKFIYFLTFLGCFNEMCLLYIIPKFWAKLTTTLSCFKEMFFWNTYSLNGGSNLLYCWVVSPSVHVFCSVIYSNVRPH